MSKKIELKVATGNAAYSLQEICPICGAYEPEGAVCRVCKSSYGDVYSRLDMTELLVPKA